MAGTGEPASIGQPRSLAEPLALAKPIRRPTRRGIVSSLALLGCFAILAGAGFIAVFAFTSVSTAGVPANLTTLVRLTSDTPGGLAQLATVNEVRLPSGRILPAGTAITTTSDQLGTGGQPAVGSTLSCQLRVGWSNGANVIDVERCATAAANAP